MGHYYAEMFTNGDNKEYIPLFNPFKSEEELIKKYKYVSKILTNLKEKKNGKT